MFRFMTATGIGLVVLSASVAGCTDESLLGPDVLLYSRYQAGAYSTVVPDGLELRLEHPAAVQRGENARLTLTLTNISADPITVALSADERADFVITTTDSIVVWEYLWTLGHNLNDAAAQRTLAPGESIQESQVWDQEDLRTGDRVEPGQYLVRGIFFGNKDDPATGCCTTRLWTEPGPISVQ